jgi:PAS domain S-box-containing protein
MGVIGRHRASRHARPTFGAPPDRKASVDADLRVDPSPTSSALVLTGSTAEPVAMTDEILSSAFDQSPSGMSVSGLDGTWLRINDAYCRMLGYEPTELCGASHRDLTHPDDVGEDRQFVSAALAGDRDSVEREKRYIRKDGSVLWARTRVEVIRDQAGSPLYFVSYVQDLSERRATLDLLHESERTLRGVIDNTPAIICVKDRDHRYRLVNREFEEVFAVSGDWIVGRSDTEIVPPSWIEDVHAKESAVLEGGEATQEEQTFTRDGEECVVLITRFPLRDEDGRIDAVCIASTDISARRVEERAKRERLQSSELIYSALAQDRLVLHGQPIVSLKSLQPVSIELLVRMREAGGGGALIAPGRFLPAAERFDLMQVIDGWVVGQAIELAASGHRVSVNLSAKTASDPAEVDKISAAVIASGAAAENLIFEITETAVADNLDAARTFAMRMRQLGCAIALDDFGVGFGTFRYLRHLPVDYLKIDMQFVRDLLTDEEDRQVVLAIVGVARQFGIATVAEGVEDEATLQELRRVGVDYAQGFYTGRPTPLPQLMTSQMQGEGGTVAIQG